MATIQNIICSAGTSAFYFDDQRAIKSGAGHDGFFYLGEPATPGFRAVRQPGESVSVMLVLSDGQVARGDCVAVQYSGAGGRDPVFLAKDFIPVIMQTVAPLLRGKGLDNFRALADEFERVRVEGRPLHAAIRYGVSQAILDGVARAQRKLPCQVVAEEFGTEVARRRVPIFCQSGDDRYANADKMILRGADVMPHGLFNNVPEKLGERGEQLLDYVKWLRQRVLSRRASPDYCPDFHIDVYGNVGAIFHDDAGRMADYLARLGEAAAPFALRVEGPMDMGGREAQCEAMAELRRRIRSLGSPVGIVADEWCNTLEDARLFADAGAADMIQIKTPDLGGIQNSAEAVLDCKAKGVGAYLGGSCNETDVSARLCAQVALAVQPDQMLAKPGMGVDEGHAIMFNEMGRALALMGGGKEGMDK